MVIKELREDSTVLQCKRLSAHWATNKSWHNGDGVPYALCRFWLAVQDLKRRPLQDVPNRAQEIWQEFLADGAQSSINLDSHSYERTSQNLKDPGRYSFEDAQVQHPSPCLPSPPPPSAMHTENIHVLLIEPEEYEVKGKQVEREIMFSRG